MRVLRNLRACTGAAVLVGVAIMGTDLLSAPASAAATTVTCSSLSGNVHNPAIVFTLDGCTGNTGGSGTVSGTTIIWAKGGVTYLTTPAFTPSGTPKRGNCASLADKYAVRDTVASDTTGSIKSGGKVSAEVCILNQGSDPWSLAPGTVFRLR